MKNLFKSLMLVAVAAMAFTACQNEPETVINNGKTTVVFNPIFDETRSYFGEKEGEGYPSSWSGNEVAKFNHWTSNGNHENIEVAINGEDRFSVTFNALSVGNTVDAYVPAASWGDPNIQWDGSYTNVEEVYRDYTIPAEQNPSATSVDEKAHILKATTTYEGGNTMDLYFEHQVAYGKLSVQNYDGGEISQYAITIDGKMYVVNSTRDAGVWFACNPVAEVQDMTISVVAADGTYTKTVIEGGNKTLAFNKGRVSTFTVDFYGITSGEAVDTFNPDVVMTNLRWSGSYFSFDVEGLSYTRLYMHADDRPNNNSIIPGEYTCCGTASTPSTAGQFGVKYSDGWSPVTLKSPSMLNVSFDNESNEYTITFDSNSKIYGYKGMPDGWAAPGKVKTALATPEVSAQVVDDKNVTVTWNEVANAANYTVSVNGVEKEAANTSRTYTIEGTYSTEYTITVVANPAVDSEDYKASAAGSATVTTNADPNVGGGEEPEEPGEGPVTYDPWACTGRVLSGTAMSAQVELTGTGVNKDVIVLSGVSMFGATITSAVLNGETVDASGTATLNTNTGYCDFNITIGNTTYIGSTSNQVV